MMEENKNLITNISSVYDTAIDRAIADVQNAWSTGNPDYTFLMIKKLVYTTSKKEIVDKYEKRFVKNANALEIMQIDPGYTEIDRYFLKRKVNRWREEQNALLYRDIMQTLEEFDLFKRDSGYGGVDVNREMQKI